MNKRWFNGESEEDFKLKGLRTLSKLILEFENPTEKSEVETAYDSEIVKKIKKANRFQERYIKKRQHYDFNNAQVKIIDLIHKKKENRDDYIADSIHADEVIEDIIARLYKFERILKKQIKKVSTEEGQISPLGLGSFPATLKEIILFFFGVLVGAIILFFALWNKIF